MQPNPIAADREIKRDGKILQKLIKVVADVRMPDGIEVDGDRPTIAAGNHQSLLDIFLATIFCHATGVSCRFMVNAKYFEGKLAGRWLRRIGCIPLNTRTKVAGFAEGKKSLANHELIGIMPEGRLTKPEDRRPQVGTFRPGVAELARESGAVVRPITFHNSGLAWPRGKWPKVRLRNRPIVTMRLGDPIDLTGATDKENAKLIENAVTELLTEVDADVAAEIAARG